MPNAPAARRLVLPWLSGLLAVLGLLLVWHLATGLGGSTTGSPTASTTSPGGITASTTSSGGVSSTIPPTKAGPTAPSATARTPDSGLAVIAESRLPSQARDTLALIRAGGPFPYSQDGVVFQNRERILPSRPGGYYHEYTVPKPGESTRGPWRLVVGAGGDTYWTADHYDSFRQVQEGR